MRVSGTSILAKPSSLATPSIAFALLMYPGHAFGDVCDKERPNWDGTPMTLWSEPLYLYTTWLGWILLLSILLAILMRRRWAYAICALFHGLCTLVLILEAGFPDPAGIRDFAVIEGCVGPPHLSVAICSCVLGIMVTLTIFNPTLKRSAQNA